MNLTRRDFLKLASLLPISLATYQPNQILRESSLNRDKSNVIIIVYDTMSACNLSLYGYPRNTAPNLERFAQKATIFHSHYSTGNFTTPGVASLLTGLYPWTHRAINQSGLIRKGLENNNIFSFIGDKYFKLAYSQNFWSDLILFQFEKDINRHIESSQFSLINKSFYNRYFSRDALIGFKSLDQFMFNVLGDSGSFFFSHFHKHQIREQFEEISLKIELQYPKGIPNLTSYPQYYLLEDVTDGVIDLLRNLSEPCFAYIHFFYPHEPYYPRKEFIGIFNDSWVPVEKKNHYLSENLPTPFLNQLRREYDEYIAHTDYEFGRLLSNLDTLGLLNNSYIIVTSDHGQLFERGVHGHVNALLYEPLIHVPLIISKPGQTERIDIVEQTSSIDLMPTILQLLGVRIPDNCEGQIMPSFIGNEKSQRSIFAVEAKRNSVFKPLTLATVAMMKDRYKLIYYIGYPGFDGVTELYDLMNDPEEMENISSTSYQISREMKSELIEHIKGSNAIYSE